MKLRLGFLIIAIGFCNLLQAQRVQKIVIEANASGHWDYEDSIGRTREVLEYTWVRKNKYAIKTITIQSKPYDNSNPPPDSTVSLSHKRMNLVFLLRMLDTLPEKPYDPGPGFLKRSDGKRILSLQQFKKIIGTISKKDLQKVNQRIIDGTPHHGLNQVDRWDVLEVEKLVDSFYKQKTTTLYEPIISNFTHYVLTSIQVDSLSCSFYQNYAANSDGQHMRLRTSSPEKLSIVTFDPTFHILFDKYVPKKSRLKWYFGKKRYRWHVVDWCLRKMLYLQF